jgi:hypothetical protein
MTGVIKSELCLRLAVIIAAQRKQISKLIARGRTGLTALRLNKQIT